METLNEIKNFFKRKLKVNSETKQEPQTDNLGNLMQEYSFSIAIQEHNQAIKLKGFNINLN